MTTTQVMGVTYDENTLSIEEQNELEEFCFYLESLLEKKINQMELHIVEGGYGNYITKFTKEEFENIPTIKQYKASFYTDDSNINKFSIKEIKNGTFLTQDNLNQYVFGKEEERTIFYDKTEAENILEYLNCATEYCCVLLDENK